ncbi:MAG: rhodanese-like domain-containing protein [Magnetococcales bacterium]|nr:rhodanese-like domain-containing protein [Magnetococcales bacterium]
MDNKVLIFPLTCAALAMMMTLAPPLGSKPIVAVKITRDIPSVTVNHGGHPLTVTRNQDTNHRLDPGFAKTSRRCPPFCIQPMIAAPGVMTIGEVELVQFMESDLKNGSGLLIDARTRDWHKRGTIPGSINIPYAEIAPYLGTSESILLKTMARFGVDVEVDGSWDFTNAKKLVMWCNGPWCGQSPAAIRGLLEVGYPADKILYYRGGMQLWKLFGLTVAQPNKS